MAKHSRAFYGNQDDKCFDTYHIASLSSLVLCSLQTTTTMQQQPVAVQLEADFRAALNRIGFTPDEQVAIIDYTGCRNLAMLGLLSEEDLMHMCKAFCTRPNNPIPLTVLQEKLLLGVLR
jgi:hypothetical protein